MTRPPIDSAMIDRAWNAVKCQLFPSENMIRKALEAALDRRTGDKDRRVELDDGRGASGLPLRRNPRNEGRRNGDVPSGHLPRKSDRLAREKVSQEQQERRQNPRSGHEGMIIVTTGMKQAGMTVRLRLSGDAVRGQSLQTTPEECAAIYAAMEAKRREEESTTIQNCWGAGHWHRRKGDPA